MNEALSQKAQAALVAILDGVIRAGDFAREQMPLVVDELLRWGMIESLIWFCVQVVLVVVSAVAAVKLARWGWRLCGTASEYCAPLVFVACLASLGVGCVSFICAVINTDWLQILIAPRVWLIEYAAGLAK